MPWQKSELTPNLGALDSTSDIRPGLGYEGLAHLKQFVEQGGLLITCEDTAQFAIDTGLAPGVSVAPQGDARVVGTVLNTVFVARDHPVAFGYGPGVPVISANGMAFNVSNTLGRTGGRVLMDPLTDPLDPYAKRATGRGSVDDSDEPQGRKITEPEPLVKQQPWEPKPLDEEQTRNNPQVIPVPEPAGCYLALLRCQDPFARWPARQSLVDCRTCRGGERAPGPGKRAAVRQQPRLSRRDHWNLRSGVQRHPQLSAPRAPIRTARQRGARSSGAARTGLPIRGLLGNVTGLSASTQYGFSLAASDSDGSSAQSTAINVTTLSNGTPSGTYTITITGKDASGVAQKGAAAVVTAVVN